MAYSTSKGRSQTVPLRVTDRISQLSAQLCGQLCTIPGCKRLASASAGSGLGGYICRYHSNLKSRHGSAWAKSFRASELQPYVRSATQLIRENRKDPRVGATLSGLSHLLAFAPPPEPAMDLRGVTARHRAKIALGRLREAGLGAERLLAIYLGVCSLFEDDWTTHRVEEFRLVQIAKAVHRKASGTHRRWQVYVPNAEQPVVKELHVYPRSSGMVLRCLGKMIDQEARELLDLVPEVIRRKTAACGVHASQVFPTGSG